MPMAKTVAAPKAEIADSATLKSSSPTNEALAEPKLLDPRLYETATVFFG